MDGQHSLFKTFGKCNLNGKLANGGRCERAFLVFFFDYIIFWGGEFEGDGGWGGAEWQENRGLGGRIGREFHDYQRFLVSTPAPSLSFDS